MEISFAHGLNFYKQFWVFFIACFLGVIIETFWCLFRFHKLESRTGLIYGPFNLVYGFGALFMTLALVRLSSLRDLWIFLIGVVIGGIWEYGCSLFQEKVLGSISWDYREFPLNIHGRINLLYCFFWGILALIWVKDTYPKLSVLIEKIPNAYGIPLTWILLIFMIFNSTMSAAVVIRMTNRQNGQKARNCFERFLDRHYPDEKVKKIFPNMTFTKNTKKENQIQQNACIS